MAKSKSSKNTRHSLKPWCWYCEREFEDEKVLLQHQKAKHFKCRHCPRKLNTAGGLMVHCQQVHKTEPDKLENTLPGRDGYDIEIFGMEGVPAKDQAEWKTKKEAEYGVSLSQQQSQSKRPRIYHGIIGENDLRLALEQHKLLMSGGKLGMPLPTMPPPPMFMPPPGMGGQPGFPGFAGGMPPFPGMGMGMGMGMNMNMGGFPQNMPPPPQFRPPFPPVGLPGTPTPSMPPQPPSFVSSPAPPASVHILPPKDGVIWPDPDASPAEKRAQQPRYRYTSPTPQTYSQPVPNQPGNYAQTSGIPSASGFAPSASNLQDKYALEVVPEAPTGVVGLHSTMTSLDGSGVQPGQPIQTGYSASSKRKAPEEFF